MMMLLLLLMMIVIPHSDGLLQLRQTANCRNSIHPYRTGQTERDKSTRTTSYNPWLARGNQDSDIRGLFSSRSPQRVGGCYWPCQSAAVLLFSARTRFTPAANHPVALWDPRLVVERKYLLAAQTPPVCGIDNVYFLMARISTCFDVFYFPLSFLYFFFTLLFSVFSLMILITSLSPSSHITPINCNQQS